MSNGRARFAFTLGLFAARLCAMAFSMPFDGAISSAFAVK
jgi:hypothetical protein